MGWGLVVKNRDLKIVGNSFDQVQMLSFSFFFLRWRERWGVVKDRDLKIVGILRPYLM